MSYLKNVYCLIFTRRLKKKKCLRLFLNLLFNFLKYTCVNEKGNFNRQKTAPLQHIFHIPRVKISWQFCDFSIRFNPYFINILYISLMFNSCQRKYFRHVTFNWLLTYFLQQPWAGCCQNKIEKVTLSFLLTYTHMKFFTPLSPLSTE